MSLGEALLRKGVITAAAQERLTEWMAVSCGIRYVAPDIRADREGQAGMAKPAPLIEKKRTAHTHIHWNGEEVRRICHGTRYRPIRAERNSW